MEEKFLALVESNITNYGLHITMVSSNTIPRFAYTIGLAKTAGFELVFAGGIYFMAKELNQIINTIAGNLIAGGTTKAIDVKDWGIFSLIETDNSWCTLLTLGIFDYYKTSYVPIYQVIPPSIFDTLDTPDMSKEYNESTAPVWKYLTAPWDLPVPEKSTVVTDLAALRGRPITDAMRWEIDEWEMFTELPSNRDKKQCRVVSIATLLAIDESLQVTLNLEVETGVWREEAGDEWVLMRANNDENE